MNFSMAMSILLIFLILDLPLTSLDLSDHIKITDIATSHIVQITRYRLDNMSKVASIYKIGTFYDWLLFFLAFGISNTNLTNSKPIFSFCTPWFSFFIHFFRVCVMRIFVSSGLRLLRDSFHMSKMSLFRKFWKILTETSEEPMTF